MYLPLDSTILGVQHLTSGYTKIKKLKHFEFSEGLQIIEYSLNRENLREIARGRLKLASTFDDLDIWRAELNCLYETHGNYKDLKAFLIGLKKSDENSNPSIQNLVRWRNDEYMLAPEKNNLKLILRAGNRERSFESVKNAKSRIRKLDSKVRRKIKEEVTDRLKNLVKKDTESDDFVVKIEEIPVQVRLRTIFNVEKETLPVLYCETRKIKSE